MSAPVFIKLDKPAYDLFKQDDIDLNENVSVNVNSASIGDLFISSITAIHSAEEDATKTSFTGNLKEEYKEN
jgi:hypothetical protein